MESLKIQAFYFILTGNLKINITELFKKYTKNEQKGLVR